MTIDGDIIVHPKDMQELLKASGEFVGVTDISSDDPVMTIVKNKNAISFSRVSGQYEWTGITQLETIHLCHTDGHVYKILEPLLPLPIKKVRMKEIDTENDFIQAYEWIKNGYSE